MIKTIEKMNFNQIFAGEVPYIVRVKVAAGDYCRGDILECVVTSGAPAANYGQAAADAKTTNDYVVCGEDITGAAEGTEVVCYKEGYFNIERCMINGAKATEASVNALRTKSIFLLNVVKQEV